MAFGHQDLSLELGGMPCRVCDFSDVYFNPNNGGAPDPSYTLAHVALNGSGYATYTTYNGSATTIMAGEDAAEILSLLHVKYVTPSLTSHSCRECAASCW